MAPDKITLIIEWSLWDISIGHHYEDESTSVKDLMYTLTLLKQQKDMCIGIITPELQKALNEAFGGREAFSFLLENTVAIEPSPELPIKFEKIPPHQSSIFILTIWKTISDPKNVFLVTEEKSYKKIFEATSEIANIKCNVVNSVEALKILKERGYI